ncbi:MAG: hypothetical protein KZQ90_11630 [Candidatus Thiodiazotropha sp. (ex Codakia rugifera)]|nr:hypothetical protein [Candidatus Thiodiazotropha sp. (ex Codakia rugifera)]
MDRSRYIKLFAQQATTSDFEDAVIDMRLAAKILADLLSASTCVEGEYEPPAHVVSKVGYSISALMDFAEALDVAPLMECTMCKVNDRTSQS